MPVSEVLNPLQHPEQCQQAFSSETSPTLWSAIPAIERLHSAWTKARKNPNYQPFHEALDAGLTKLEGYYEKTADSDAHIIAMRMYIFIILLLLLLISVT